jgi:hypothetical protein
VATLKVLVTLTGLLFSLALAHGLQMEASGQRIVTTDEGQFLEVSIDPPDVQEQVYLTAVATASGAAQLEQQSDGAYLAVSRIPIVQEHNGNSFGVDTPYRIRLLEAPRDSSAFLTLLFTGGTILRLDAPVEGAQGRPLWHWLTLFFVALTIVALFARVALQGTKPRARKVG